MYYARILPTFTLQAFCICLGLLFLAQSKSIDASEGAIAFKQCASCHQVGKGAVSLVGPPLNGIVDAPIAAQDFNYTPGLRALASNHDGWSEELLHAFLANPLKLASGTNMVFAGVASVGERDAIIRYLKSFTDAVGNTETAVINPRDPEPPTALLEQKGDLAYGEYLASECATCHQEDGSVQGIPSITGWPRKAFITALHAYKIKARENEVMQQIAGALGDEEFASLADYFAQQ